MPIADNMRSVSSRLAARVAGFAVGLGIGVAGVVIAFGLDAARATSNPVGPTVAVPVLMTAAIVGLMFGGSAWTARTRRDWLQLIGRLGVSVVLVGDGVVLAGLAGSRSFSTDPGAYISFVTLVAGGAFIYIVGLVVVGWFVLPIALVVGAIWAVSMRAIRHAFDQRAANSPHDMSDAD